MQMNNIKQQFHKNLIVYAIAIILCALITLSLIAKITQIANAQETSNQEYSTSNATIQDGAYYICCSSNINQVVDVSGGSASNGANVQIYSTNQTRAQQWTITNQNDGTVTIKNGSGKYLDVAGAQTGNGINVWQYQGNNTKAQKWNVTKYNNTYKFTSALSSKYVLDISGGQTGNGTNVQIWSDNSSTAQRFMLIKKNPDVASSTYLPEDGHYAIQSFSNANYFVDLDAGSSADGANIHLWSGVAGKNENQAFELTNDGNGYYAITNRKTKKAIDVAACNIWPGTNIWQYRCNNTDAQKWSLQQNEDGSIMIVNKGTGLTMDIAGGQMKNGTNICGYINNQTKAQKWAFVALYSEGANITFDYNGGSTKVNKTSFSTDYGKTYGEFVFDQPYKQGYTFDHWSETGATGVAIDPDKTIPHDVILTAVYRKALTNAEYFKTLGVEETTINDLYELNFQNPDYDYFMNSGIATGTEAEDNLDFSCTSVRYGDFYGRNLDSSTSYENYLKTYIVRTSATSNRHATIGTAMLNTGEPTASNMAQLKKLPFYTYDGINDSGVVCSGNALNSADLSTNKGTDPTHANNSNTGDLYFPMLIRYVLDYADDVDGAINLLSHKNIYAKQIGAYKESHIQIADSKGNNAIVEFIYPDGKTDKTEMKVIRFNKDKADPGSATQNMGFKGITTNFPLYTYDGTISSLQKYSKHGWGIERYKLIDNLLYGTSPTSVTTTNEMLGLMQNVYYSKAYNKDLYQAQSEDFWWSEFFYNSWNINSTHTTEVWDNNPLIKNQVLQPTGNLEKTLYSTAYDIKNLKLEIYKGEDTTKSLQFNL